MAKLPAETRQLAADVCCIRLDRHQRGDLRAVAIRTDIMATIQGSQSVLLDEQELYRFGSQFCGRKNVSTIVANSEELLLRHLLFQDTRF